MNLIWFCGLTKRIIFFFRFVDENRTNSPTQQKKKWKKR
jgi:hypothetical protein